ncbi:MAG: GNAT family N-acetyltransferase [Prevotella sp.]|nr:GNAT family N-acetyltransferase [Prevotella sp.]
MTTPADQALPTVSLRAMEPEDLDMLYRIENDAQLWDVGATNVPYSRYTLHDYIAHASGDIYADRQVRLIAENADGHPVGIVDIVNFEPRHCRAEVGIVVERPLRRRCYAQAVLRELHHYARHVLHLHQLFALIAADNEAACALFRKMGYRQTATLQEWLFDGRNYADAKLFQAIL